MKKYTDTEILDWLEKTGKNGMAIKIRYDMIMDDWRTPKRNEEKEYTKRHKTLREACWERMKKEPK